MAPPSPHNTVNVVETSRVAPPPNSVTHSSLPLTSFDILMLRTSATQRLFFYELTHPKTYFIRTILPILKRSLALTLQLFYPLAGNLTYLPETQKYEIRYTEGDSVELKVAESDADFNQIVQNNPRDATVLHPLLPELPPVSDLSPTPVLAVQVTVFPASGVSIGVSAHHAAVDGRSFMHFMKSWAAVSCSGDASSVEPLPLYDRTTIKQTKEFEIIFATDSEKSEADSDLGGSFDAESKRRVESVRATFVLKRSDIERLRRLVSARQHAEKFRYSTFALTCAYVWVCLAKARHDVGEEDEYFAFPADCRARLDPSLPETYFGNCIGGNMTKMKGRYLLGEDGISVASDAISEAIRGLGNGVSWDSGLLILPPTNRTLSVTGSPIFRVYDTDFGWGRARKVEVISIERTNAISIAENRDEGDGGVEIGLVRPKNIMDSFVSAFEEGLREEK
eukprot:TRINITY_DN1258_c0_g1_i3.p1 TRINITY_DN1258_c0_g1~~TRINITY_DN1258_c0_g1_i3.p1  ORF type:complete len:451 (+),score=0.84 TRINITY_DN1258_c0_g1_i3:177-1529(+)